MSLTTVVGQLATIADALANSPASTRVAIQEKEKLQEREDTVRVLQEDNSLFSWLGRGVAHVARSVYNISPFACIWGKSYPQQTVPLDASTTTAEYFQKVFGEKRVSRIDQKLSICFDRKKNAQDYFCKTDVEKIFVGSSEITWDDVEELFREIKDFSMPKVRFLTEAETKLLRYYFAPAEKLNMSASSQAELGILHWLLSPFAKVQHIFLNKLPIGRSFRAIFFNDSPFDEMKKRVWSYESISGLSHNHAKWALVLAKELSGRNLPSKVLIPHVDGYLVNFHEIEGGGKLKYLLKTTSPFAPSYFLYAGTRPPNRASREENYRVEMASKGPIVTRAETEAYLNDPQKGFVMSKTERVAAIGFSQGGVHASRDAVLFFPKFSKIVTVCAPAFEKETVLHYAQLLRKNGRKVQIIHLTEQDDQVSRFGVARLGLQCDPELAHVTYAELTPGKKMTKPYKPMPCPTSRVKAVAKLVGNALQGSHLRTVLGRELVYSKVFTSDEPKDQRELQEHLLQKHSWEEIRQKLVKLRLFRVNDELPSFVKVCESLA